MKKKNLIILLIFPFLISVFCIIAVNTTYNKIDVDISYIDWEYHDMEAFQLSSGSYELKARGVNQRHYAVTGDSSLVWTVTNKNADDPIPCAEIYVSGGKSFLKAVHEGEVTITCSNKKGNIFRQMTGIIYKDAALLLYPVIGSSQNNVDSTVYYGQYDHRIGTPAGIDMTFMVVPESANKDIIVNCTENITFDQNSGRINIVGTGKASLTLSLASGLAAPQTFSFEIVKDGVNVYNYDDLLYCTNRSEHGEIAVLRKSFESVLNAYKIDENGKPILSDGKPILKSNNVECFGNYNAPTGKFSFSGEIYRFTTTYNRSFIDQWNQFAEENQQYSKTSDTVNVGLRVQKDFYGNGYTLNLHNLTYPYAYVLMTTDDGGVVRIPQLTKDNLFRGPLKLYSLGDPNNMPLVSLYGQDNVGMYVEGDGITVNDINLKNCEFGDRLANLATVGTVMEVAGDNITVKNSRLSNGKHVLRSYSSMNFTLSNSMLSHSQNFLFLTGSNEYVTIPEDAKATFSLLDGGAKTALIHSFLAPEAEGDEIVNRFMMSYFTSPAEKNAMQAALTSIQNAINQAHRVRGDFKGSTEIVDCFFYQSGITSIGMESQFNSSFLQDASPSMISEIFSMIEETGRSIIPMTPTGMSGTSYPVKLNISGDTRFYDYKIVDNIELEGLIEENITDLANSLGVLSTSFSIDMVFPLKSMIRQYASSQSYTDPATGKKYTNIPIAFFGGGLNLSEVTWNDFEHSDNMSGKIEIDLLESYLNLSGSSSGASIGALSAGLGGIVLKTVITVTGYEPFYFHFVNKGYLYGETPKITDLISNAKGE